MSAEGAVFTVTLPGILARRDAIGPPAKDARLESHTDMMFIQVDPFEREFSQSQQSGGGGGGGGGGGQGSDPSEISRREKEMIAGTFKQLGDKKATVKEAAETAKFLSDAQSTLRHCRWIQPACKRGSACRR